MPGFRRRAAARDAEASPGPQRLQRRSLLGPVYVSLLLLFVALLVVHAFVRENFPGNDWPPRWFWSLRLIDLNNSVTVFVALLSLIAVRQQFIYGTKPYLVYSGRFASESSLGLEEDGGRFWVVTLENVGAGAAAVRSSLFRAAGGKRAVARRSYAMSAGVAREYLEELGLVLGRDCSLTVLGRGARIAAGARSVVFECREDRLRAIAALDLQLTFEAALGDRFVKEIHLIPRQGAF